MKPTVAFATVLEVDIRTHGLVARMHLEDLLTALDIGIAHQDLTVEPARTQQRRVQNILAVGGGNDDATNRKDILDPALLRPGRFDRQILVGYPDVKGREEILKVHVRNKPMGPHVNLQQLWAKATVGFTGADLENVVNEAALLAARANKRAITMKEIEDATIKVIAGPEKRSKVVTEKEKRLTAYHEAGHAVCTYYCPTQDPVHEISIIPRGMAGGYTMSLPEDDRGCLAKTAMQENIVTLLGGRDGRADRAG